MNEDTAIVLRGIYRALDVGTSREPPLTEAELLLQSIGPRVAKGRAWAEDQIALHRASGTAYYRARAELAELEYQLKEARGACPHGRAMLVRRPTADDQQQVCLWCPICEQNTLGPARWIRHDLLLRAGITNVRALPLHPEAGLEAVPLCCSRCHRQVPVQLHHWGPRGRFSDADDWPTDYLCLDCHREWHDVMGWGNEVQWGPAS